MNNKTVNDEAPDNVNGQSPDSPSAGGSRASEQSTDKTTQNTSPLIGQMTDVEKEQSELVAPSRRDFLKVAAGAVLAQQALTSCGQQDTMKLPHITDEQRRFKRKEPSVVSLLKCPTYADLTKLDLVTAARESQIPDVKNQSVLLKINMVDYRSDRPLTTDNAVIEAAVKLMTELGASKIVVGDASALNRDTEYLLEATGIGACCKKLNVPFVDLNIDDLDKVPNIGGLTREKHFLLPRTVTKSDIVVSMPKLKTHRWALVTAALKNLFGAIPGRAYGWPKNFLHVNGIDSSVVDIALAIKPGFAIVDAIVAMEGHGPLDGHPIQTGFLIMGADLAAVDAIGCRTMKIDPLNVAYMRIAEEVLGNTTMQKIKLNGVSIESVATEFKLPRTYKRETSGKIASVFEERSSASGAT